MRSRIPPIRYLINAYISNDKSKNDKREWKYKRLSIMFSIIAAVATSIMTVFTYRLGSISQEQMGIYRESVVIENRAYIVQDGMHELVSINTDTTLILKCDFKNVGKTPAYDVTRLGGPFFYKEKEPPDGYTGNLERTTIDSGITIGSNMKLNTMSKKFAIDDTFRYILRSESLYMFFYSYISYRDVFGSTRFTITCNRYDWDTGSFIATKNNQYSN